MKVTINEKGTLIVTPETPLEEYALNKWKDDYFDAPREATFHINNRAPEFLELHIRGLG